MTHEQQLPVTEILDPLHKMLATQNVVILEAPPGAGKTTCVPLALLDADWLTGRKILMLEPRRLAARNAASYMARKLGETVGQTLGYRIRHEQKVSARTRIEIVTEGILVRRLQTDPELTGVGLVIFDEFHERNISSDLGLALVNDLRKGLREDLRILVMSATLDAAPLVRLLGAGRLRSEGRSWPVDVRYLGGPLQLDCRAAIISTIQLAVSETSGDILTFLPGIREIEAIQRQLQTHKLALEICPLHGQLSSAAQQRALAPAPLRKLILATNIAETSLTIDGVAVVIDSGLCRRASFNPGAGLGTLKTARISQASAQQRSGRAGRQGPGICYRLWSEGVQTSLLPQTPAEISNCDLTPLALNLACWGISDARQLDWLDPPPTGALTAARNLLQRLELLDHNQFATAAGRKAVSLPTHPRFAKMLLYAQKHDQLPTACLLSAYFEEGSAGQYQGDDIQQELARVASELVQDRSQKSPLNRTYNQLAKRLNAAAPDTAALRPEVLSRLLLCAYPDRLAHSPQRNQDFLIANGQGAQLRAQSQLRGNPWLIVCDIHQQEERRAQIRSALIVDEGLIEELRKQSAWQARHEWDEQKQRILGCCIKAYGALELVRQQRAVDTEACLELLCARIRREGEQLLNWDHAVSDYLGRIRLLHATLGAPWPDMRRETLVQNPEEWLAPFLNDITTRAELRRFKLLPAVQNQLGRALQIQLDQLAPKRLQLPGGERIKIDYSAEEPRLPVKLQQLFGRAETPAICQGRVPLKLELLSPAGRALAITSDLRTFWDQVYPEVKKEMRGRYPKHPWPDDPWQARPTGKTKKRSG